MRIDDLTVKNFNGFEHRTFSFNPHFNLLVGDNATGKSSVLDALAVAAGCWFLGLRGYEKSPGIHAEQVRVAAHAHLDSYTFEKQFPSMIECAGVVTGQRINWARELQRERGRTTTVNAKSISEVASEAERRVRAGDKVTLPLICAYGTERLWFEKGHHTRSNGTTGTRRRPSRLDGYRDCLNLTLQETALIDWVRDQSTVSLQTKKDTVALAVVKSAITKCVEGAESLYYDGRYNSKPSSSGFHISGHARCRHR